MRVLIAVIATLVAASAFDAARADPYRWCAVYGMDGGAGSQNCYFLTLEQCEAAISGVGGLCLPNPFYDGRPVTTPEDFRPRPRRRAR